MSEYECEVCCNETKKIIKCPYCMYKSCIECNEKCILDSINKPRCISCKKEFSSSFFHDNFTKTFITKKYKLHREKLLFEKEKYLLPATQPEVEKIYKKREYTEELKDIKKIIDELKMRENELRLQIYRLDFPDETDKKEEKELYVSPCPVNDCRGFLSTRYKCGVCGINACSECREIKKDDHVCDPNILESVKEIKKTSRNCPNCKTLIFKISGCDQMFCTQCHIAFCWKTGKVEKGLIHNPHYFEYMRSHGDIPRNPFEERCGGFPLDDFIYDKFFRTDLNPVVIRFDQQYNKLDNLLFEIYRQVVHIRNVEMRGLPTNMDNNSNQDLRIQFLMKEITEDQFRIKLQRREKDKEKKIEYREVLDMYVNIMQDLITELRDTKNFKKFLDEEEKVRKYVDHGIYKINSKYDSKLKDIKGFFQLKKKKDVSE
jgi:hypothetical protein